MKTLRISTLLLVSCAASSLPLAARADVSAGFGAGSTGAGINVTVPVSSRLDVRAKTGNGSLHATITADGQPYQGNFNLSNQTLILDVHPTSSAFVVSVGAFANGNTISATGQSQNGSITINGQTYTTGEAGTVTASAAWSNVTPYLGIGFAPSQHRAGLGLEAGAAFQGAPNVGVTATGSMATDPAFRQNLNRAQQKIAQALAKFNVYPVLDLRYTFKV